MNVTIDGIEYAPIGSTRPSIGVAITTHNRRDIALDTEQRWRQHLPPGAILVIVDDASTQPYPGADHRFDTQAGIAAAKNKCLELLDQAGVEHLFLADDDTYPLTPDWWQPYVNSPEPHLMYVFPYKGGPPIVATDETHTAWAHPCGALLYLHRDVLQHVGGMDREYGIWGHEHVDYSNRIHNAGLTTWRFADVTGSSNLIYCLDQDGTERSIPKATRDQQLATNRARYQHNLNSKAYMNHYEPTNTVLTCWQHGPDRQRNGKTSTAPTAEAAKTLKHSITGGTLVTLGDDDTADHQVTDLGLGIYLSRWIHYREWLRDQPGTVWVWCVDTNDVQMQIEPWPHMQQGLLYCGWEPDIVGSPWMRANHPAQRLQDFLDTHHDKPLLNCGVFGGDRGTVLEFLTQWARLIEDNARERWEGTETGDLGADMGPFNYLAYTRFADRIATGPRVTTVFKKNETNTWSWWRHK